MSASRRPSTALLAVVLVPLALAPVRTHGQSAVASRPGAPSIDDPQLSPDGRTIAFVARTGDRARGPTSVIHRLDVESGRHTPLTSDLERASSPRWSPDGRRLAFLGAGAHDEDPQIHVLEIESGASRQVTRHPTPPGDLAWAPDSRLVFFTAADAATSDRRHLSVVDLDGVTTQITFGAYAILDYALSPSGGTIAMTRAPSAPPGARRGREVWVMDANGGNAYRLTTGAERARRPQVSPDGASVAFLAPRAPGTARSNLDTVVVMPRRGGTPRSLPVAMGPVREVQWLSDARLALVVDRAGLVQLVELEVASGRIEVRTPRLPVVGHWTVHRRSGTQVFTAPGLGGRLELYLMPPGEPMRQVPRER